MSSGSSSRWWLAPALLIVCVTLMLSSLAFSPSGQTSEAGSGTQRFDVVIRNGTVYDGSGGPGVRADVGLLLDRIVAVGNLSHATAETVIDARGLAVAPGFINMLSWSTESLLIDGRAQGGIRQGVTTEIMGEGTSMGPLTGEMKRRVIENQTNLRYDVTWTTLAEYLQELERRGIAPNVASFIGAATIREYVIGLDDKLPTPEQLDRMRELVRREMEAGALGIGSSLIYAPGTYASTEELIELCKVAAQYQGKYISHIRSEGTRLVEAVDELLRISRDANIPAEIYHLKAAGNENWSKMDQVLATIEQARADGLKITADMYLYPAGATGLDASIPPSAQDGGYEALFRRLEDPAQRRAIAQAIRTPSTDWENLFLAAGRPDRVLLVSFKSSALQPFVGKTLQEIMTMRGEQGKGAGKDPAETIIDLVLEDRSSPGAVYFMMDEANITKQLRRPWVSIGSDAASMATEGAFLRASTHPRAYGNTARLLGKYVREDGVLTLQDAIHRMTGLPATNLGLDRRGFLKPGYFADVVVFDPKTIADRATFDHPHQYSVGVRDVFVNGMQVLAAGEHTGAKPGRALWGPGRKSSN